MTGIEKEHSLDELNLTLWGEVAQGKNPLDTIRLREVLWKPTIAK